MKPSAFRIERLLAKVEAEVARRWLRARRYVFHPDEVAEAEAQGLPYVLVPRDLSSREWMERYGEGNAGSPPSCFLGSPGGIPAAVPFTAVLPRPPAPPPAAAAPPAAPVAAPAPAQVCVDPRRSAIPASLRAKHPRRWG
jgi:hypothetical protein